MTGWWLAMSQAGLGVEAGGREGLAANCSLPTSHFSASCSLPPALPIACCPLPTSMPELPTVRAQGSPSVGRRAERAQQGGEKQGSKQREEVREGSKGERKSSRRKGTEAECPPGTGPQILLGGASITEAGLWLSLSLVSVSPHAKGEMSCEGSEATDEVNDGG